MPFFRDPNLDKDDEQAGVQISSSGMQVGQDGNPAKEAQQSGPATGSRFTNLDSYLNNNDAKGFGQQFGSNIQNSINTAGSNMDSIYSGVKSQIGHSKLPATEGQIRSAVANAGDKTTDEDAKQYQDWTNQTYTGPKSLGDNAAAQGQYWGQADKAANEAKAAGTEAGRFSLLDQYYGRPSYNFGEKGLDNLLIQGGGGFTDPKAYQDQAAGLYSKGDTQSQDIAQTASVKSGEVAASKKAAREAIGLQDDNTIKGGAIGTLQDQIEARRLEQDQTRDTNWDLLLNDLKDDNVSKATASQLGLSDGQHLYDLGLTKYLKERDPTSKYTAATDEEYGRYLALSKLAGLDPTYLTADQRGQSGKQGPDAKFDNATFSREAAEQQAAYNRDADSLVFTNDSIPGGGHQSKTINQMKDQLAWENDYYAKSGLDINAWRNGSGPAPAASRWMAETVAKFDKDRGLNRTLKSQGSTSLPKDFGSIR